MYYLQSNLKQPLSRKIPQTHIVAKRLLQDLTQAINTSFYTYIHLYEKHEQHYIYKETHTVYSHLLNLFPKNI